MQEDRQSNSTWVLLVACPDRPGIVAAVANFIASLSGNIVNAEQHTDDTTRTFHQRVEFTAPTTTSEKIETAFGPTASAFDMSFSVHQSHWRPRTAILASRQSHCLTDLLSRTFVGELPLEVVKVISDRPDNEAFTTKLGFDYQYLPIADESGLAVEPASTGSPRSSSRQVQEAELAQLLESLDLDLVILARYMRVLPAGIVNTWSNRMINIHHSFLPAFIGANPYQQAHERGVKVIGATAHYVTEELDAGPIIEQDVVHVSHRDDVETLARRGRDLETLVLARAVRAHVEHRVQVVGNHTVVFS